MSTQDSQLKDKKNELNIHINLKLSTESADALNAPHQTNISSNKIINSNNFENSISSNKHKTTPLALNASFNPSNSPVFTPPSPVLNSSLTHHAQGQLLHYPHGPSRRRRVQTNIPQPNQTPISPILSPNGDTIFNVPQPLSYNPSSLDGIQLNSPIWSEQQHSDNKSSGS